MDAGSDYEKALAAEIAKLQRLYGGGDLTSFPEFKFSGESGRSIQVIGRKRREQETCHHPHNTNCLNFSSIDLSTEDATVCVCLCIYREETH